MIFNSTRDRETASIKNEILRAWTKQLYGEFNNICYHYKLKLSKPLIEVTTITGRWGEWRPNERKIVISTELIRRFSWDHVIAVLKHEIAHQIVWELYGSDEKHGPLFKRACKQLGLESWASISEFELSNHEFTWKERRLSVQEEKLLKRAEKLMALASSENENEAALAMQRLQDIYKNYNFLRIKNQTNSHYRTLILRPKKKRLDYHYTLLAAILTQYFFVEVIFAFEYDPTDLVEYKTLEILGEEKNVAMAEYVYHFMLRHLDSLWQNYQKFSSVKGVKKRNDFYMGILNGFAEKLKKNRMKPVAMSSESSEFAGSLISVSDTMLYDYIRFKHPKLRSRRAGKSRQMDFNTYSEGVRQGRDINIHGALKRGAQGYTTTQLLNS